MENGNFNSTINLLIGPFKYVNTAIWSNIDGEWKMQFNQNSFKLQSE